MGPLKQQCSEKWFLIQPLACPLFSHFNTGKAALPSSNGSRVGKYVANISVPASEVKKLRPTVYCPKNIASSPDPEISPTKRLFLLYTKKPETGLLFQYLFTLKKTSTTALTLDVFFCKLRSLLNDLVWYIYMYGEDCLYYTTSSSYFLKHHNRLIDTIETFLCNFGSELMKTTRKVMENRDWF